MYTADSFGNNWAISYFSLMKYLTPFIILLLASLPAVHAAQSMSAEDASYLKYDETLACYHAGKCAKAYRLFEEVMPLLIDKKEIISATFYQACSSFYRRSLVKLKKSYKSSAHQFQSFYKTYPKAPQAEEALYMQDYALYLASPDIEVDQATTHEALQTLQTYLDQYPAGLYRDQALQYQEKLNDQLAHKAFNKAKRYHELSKYQAAVTALTNFQQDFPNHSLGEEAAYLKADAQCKLAQKGPKEAQQDRLRTT